MANVDAVKHARIKGLILKILKDEYPHGVDVVVMRSVLAGLNFPLTEKELAGYLHYLCNAKYIEAKRDAAENILWVRLDNEGLKLLDGWLCDHTIIFG